MVGKHYNCPFSFFPLPLRKKKEHVHLMLTWGLSRERGHERCHEQSCMIFFSYRDEANISCNVEMY